MTEIIKQHSDTGNVRVDGMELPRRTSRVIPLSALRDTAERWDRVVGSKQIGGDAHVVPMQELVEHLANNPDAVELLIGKKSIA